MRTGFGFYYLVAAIKTKQKRGLVVPVSGFCDVCRLSVSKVFCRPTRFLDRGPL